MSVTNAEIAALFEELADIMELAGENYFKVKAYRNAAEAIRRQPGDLSQMTAEDVSKIPGVGDAISAKIAAAIATSTFPTLEGWRRNSHLSLRPLLTVQGVTMRQIRGMIKTLGISSMDDLKAAVTDGRLDSYKKLDNETRNLIEQLTHRRI